MIESEAWLRLSALLHMTCFLEGLYVQTWFSSQFTNILTFNQFVYDFMEQFVSSAVDLTAVYSQWSVAKQRKGDSESPIRFPILPTSFGSRVVLRSFRTNRV